MTRSPRQLQNVNVEEVRCEELTEIDVEEISTPAIAVKTALQTRLECGLAMSLANGCDFDVANIVKMQSSTSRLWNPTLLIGSQRN